MIILLLNPMANPNQSEAQYIGLVQVINKIW